MLNVIEIFKSIQGEGLYTGYPAIFIRLAGCCVQCEWCDTDYVGNTKRMIEVQIIEEIKLLGKGIIVITGGEPLIQDLTILIKGLQNENREVHIETSGSPDCLSNYYDKSLITCSPKTEKLIWTMKYASSWKYVIGNNMKLDSDGLPSHLAKPLNNSPIFLQPLATNSIIQNKINISWVVHLVKKHNYRLSLQTHKILNIRYQIRREK